MAAIARPAGIGGSLVLILAIAVWAWPAWPDSPGDVLAAGTSSFVESELWLRPTTGDAPALGAAVADLASGKAKEALAAFRAAAGDPVLGAYARLYQGRAELALDRPDDAEASARAVIGRAPGGYLGEAALWLLADAALAKDDAAEARRALSALVGLPTANLAQAHLRLGKLALETNDLSLAGASLSTVFYDFPLSAEAAEAAGLLKRLVIANDPDRVTRELARAERLFAGGRFSDARKAYVELAARAPAGDPALAELRIAACDLSLGHHAAALTALRKIEARGGPRADEAGYLALSAIRSLGRDAEYVRGVRAYVDRRPSSPFAEKALNDLGTYYILEDDDATAAQVFAEMVGRFPRGAFAERAAWKSGWWAYKTGDYAETIRLFGIGLANFPRSDYRPSWLYWTARSHGRLGQLDAARHAYRTTIAAYRNSYYGRQAARAMTELPPETLALTVPLSVQASSPRPLPFPASAPQPPEPAPGASAVTAAMASFALTPGRVPSNAPLVRALLLAGLNDDAVAELRKVQRDEGTSPFIEATIAYALNRKGDLRGAITAMRRAYPQFMAEGGEQLPVDLLKVIFPLDYWDLIRRQAQQAKLDPYLTAALVAQESTFQAAVRSSANAWGLMQILPSTGRRYAPFLGLGRVTTSRLTDPNVNVRIGTAYFADLMKQFGDPALALAAYNAGENRVERWMAERPGLDRDEFIDDIPFPETQNYVKRIIGTAEDYRILYGAAEP